MFIDIATLFVPKNCMIAHLMMNTNILSNLQWKRGTHFYNTYGDIYQPHIQLSKLQQYVKEVLCLQQPTQSQCNTI